VLGTLIAAPLAIDGMLTIRDAVTAAAAGPSLSESTSRALRAYEQFLAQQAASDQFSGTVLMAHRGEAVLARSYGMADKARAIPNRLDTIFGLASLGKAFAGVAAGQLASQGKISFFATLGTYLDGFPTQIADTVTVHQLFTHTSGMGNYQSDPVWQQQARSWTTPAQEFADTMAAIQRAPLLFTPGNAYGYSNSGYYTVGAIVAAVSGQPFGDYVREHVFRPAGITRTDYYTAAQILANRDIAHAYGPAQPDGSRVDLTTAPHQIAATGGGGGAGGGLSSAPDLLRFAGALQDGTLLQPAYAHLVAGGKYPLGPHDLSDQPPSPSIMVAYGFEERIVNQRRIFGHGGAAPLPGGIATDLSVYPELDWVTVLLSNYYVDTIPYLQMQDAIITQETAGHAF
jgi:CubicO group peptidase (beta-lactamase class C family)